MQGLQTKTVGVCLLASILAGGPALYGQISDSEPNNTCQTAQNIGTPVLPLVFSGELLTPPDQPDVDFFQVSLPPGSFLRIELFGSAGGGGTLVDPYLGAFDSNCDLIQISDDYNGPDSRIETFIPPDGILILAVTACCDSSFEAGGVGSYTLTVAEPVVAGPVTGRLVNARDGEPINGDNTYVSLELQRCSDPSSCFFQAYTTTDSGGRFQFSGNYYGGPLDIGDYQILAYAEGFSVKTVGPFSLDSGGVDLGDLALEPYRLIHSVSLRLVDALDGRPLGPGLPSWPNVALNYCTDYYCSTVAFAVPDDMGRVHFEEGSFSNGYLFEGNYTVAVYADQYEYTESPPFFVAEGEDFDFGEFRARPFPIQVLDTQPCQVGRAGGSCNFRTTLRNGLGTKFTGEAWVLVGAYGGTLSPYGTTFQVGKQGTVNPQAQKLNILKGGRATLDFKFDAYAQASEGTLFCASILVGRDPVPVLNVVGSRFLLCLLKGSDGYRVMPEKEGRKKLLEFKQAHPNR